MNIGIRREDKNEWEGRAPLIPDDIHKLQAKNGIKFYVQPSLIRAFKDEEYEKAGAIIQEDLSDCQYILGVKEMPVNFFTKDKNYIFFSHTIKGQKSNMPILHRMMELKNTLIDYERILDENQKRLVFFGKFAGLAGMIDTFWAYGQRMLFENIDSPFSEIKQANYYFSLDRAKEAIQNVGKRISDGKLNACTSPFIIGIAGYGNVSQGVLEIVNLLACEIIKPEDLGEFVKKGKFSTRKIYIVIFKEQDTVRPINLSKPFILREYYEHPEKYESKFEQYIKYLTIFIDAIYWDEKYPRLITKEFLKRTYQRENFKLKVIGDITCDIEGAVECTLETTNTGNPIYVYEPATGKIKYGAKGNGPVILAVDNLPCEISRESSCLFSNVLSEFIPKLDKADNTDDFAVVQLPPEFKKATILYNGNLTPGYKYLEKYLNR